MTRRLPLRRRRAADPVTGAEPPPAPPAPGATDVTAVQPALAPEAEAGSEAVMADPHAPAGLAVGPEAPPAAPSFRDRGRLRRRLRYLRRVRELGFRDLGGLVFDLHRFGRDGSHLVNGKLEALGAVDVELRALETVLDERRDVTVLREPGIAACPRCAALHGSDANFCPNCGLAFSGPQAISGLGAAQDAPVPLVTPGPPAAPTAASEGPADVPAPGPDPAAPLWVPEEQPTSVQPAVPPAPAPGQPPGPA